jgi:hypothetical protein
LYTSPSTGSRMKSKRLRWAGCVARVMREKFIQSFGGETSCIHSRGRKSMGLEHKTEITLSEMSSDDERGRVNTFQRRIRYEAFVLLIVMFAFKYQVQLLKSWLLY